MIGKLVRAHKTTILLAVMMGIGIMQAFCQGAAETTKGTKGKAVAATAPKEQKATTAADTTAKAASHQLIVYYFRTTYRCPSCYFIEQTTQKALNETFADSLKNGRVVFRMINVQEPGNEHYTNDYQIFTKSVVLSDVKAGKQMKWKNLDQVWNMINREDEFKAYIVKEVKAFLGA
jgi:hypothetical protein